MRLLIENYLSIFLVAICTLLCTSFISSELQINNARDYHSYCIAMIEASDFDKDVIEKCTEEAENRGYTLSVTSTSFEKLECNKCGEVFSIKNMDVVECPNCGSTSDTGVYYTYLNNRICTVELKYNIKIGLLGIKKEGVLNGYAR